MTVCPLCASEHVPGIRCPECNVDPGFGPDRPSPFTHATLWAMMGGIAARVSTLLMRVGWPHRPLAAG